MCMCEWLVGVACNGLTPRHSLPCARVIFRERLRTPSTLHRISVYWKGGLRLKTVNGQPFSYVLGAIGQKCQISSCPLLWVNTKVGYWRDRWAPMSPYMFTGINPSFSCTEILNTPSSKPVASSNAFYQFKCFFHQWNDTKIILSCISTDILTLLFKTSAITGMWCGFWGTLAGYFERIRRSTLLACSAVIVGYLVQPRIICRTSD